MKTDLTQERLKEVLHYDPDTGIFTRIDRKGRSIRPNRVAGHVEPRGYIKVGVDRQSYYGHRLAFFYMVGKWPKDFIDHIDGDCSNNKWENLREATPLQSVMNTRKSSKGSLGYKGISRDGKRYKAEIRVNGKKTHLGDFDTPEEAHKAYCRAADKYYGEFANYG
jgi:hypothetical protein